MAPHPITHIDAETPETRRIDAISDVLATDLAAATELALGARADGLSAPLIHHLVGLHLKQSGRFEEAIVELGRGLELDPENLKLMLLVGFCLLELERRTDAARVFEAAVRLDPNSAEAAYGYGWAAENLGALAQAQSHWERALRIEPNHADALAGLAGLAARRRDWDIARRQAQLAVILDPGQTDALMNLARVDLGVGDFGAAARRLGDLIERPSLKPLARANARIMLGDALDGLGDVEGAFAAYEAGKNEVRALHKDAFEAPGVPSATDVVRAILAEFRQTAPESWASSAPSRALPEHRGHAFLLGFPRSGTTLLEQVLATHPEVVAMGERPALAKAEAEFLSGSGGVKRLSGVVSDFLEPFRADYWRRVREFGLEPRGKVFIDKQPLNTFRLPLISKVFPNAKILFAIRDPRDVVLSCFRRSFNMNASMYQFNTIEGAALYYAAVMEAGQAYVTTLPLEVFQIRYEDLVTDFTGTAGAICDFLDIERTETLERFSEGAGERLIATPSSTQVGRGLYEDGMNQWRRYAFALEPALPILAPWIETFGYAPT